VIVLDDASTDDSLEVLDRIAKSRPLRIIANAGNSGSVCRQWQRGVAAATGDFIWIAEADDLAAPGFLEKAVAALERPGVVMSYCQSRQIDHAGEPIADDYLDYVADFGADRWRNSFVADLAEELRRGLAVKNTIPNVSGVVFRRDALAAVMERHLDQIAGFKVAGDWMTYLRLLERGSIAFHPEPLNLHRRHAGGVTIGADHRPHLEEVRRVQHWVAEQHALTPDIRLAAEQYCEFLKRYFGIDAGTPAAS
jgi:glycosyltransferase involved in cell wall biosynthesis